MNLGQSVAICLYELVRAESGGKGTERQNQNFEPATAAKLELLTSVLSEIMRDCGYLKSVASSEETRRLIHRMCLDERDAETWLGVLRQIVWKLRVNQHEPG
jgi:tRNA/rRNA methyltransferase